MEHQEKLGESGKPRKGKEREKKVYSIFMVLILIESFPLSLNNVKEKETEES